MNKTIRRITAATLAGAMATCMAVTANAASDENKCSCGITTTSTLDVTSKSATATTSTMGSYMVNTSVTIEGQYYVKGTTIKQNTSNGWGAPNASRASIYNDGEIWIGVSSTHSMCCSDSRTTLKW